MSRFSSLTLFLSWTNGNSTICQPLLSCQMQLCSSHSSRWKLTLNSLIKRICSLCNRWLFVPWFRDSSVCPFFKFYFLFSPLLVFFKLLTRWCAQSVRNVKQFFFGTRVAWDTRDRDDQEWISRCDFNSPRTIPTAPSIRVLYNPGPGSITPLPGAPPSHPYLYILVVLLVLPIPSRIFQPTMCRERKTERASLCASS